MSALPQPIATYVLEQEQALSLRLLKAFGTPDEPVATIEARCRIELADFRTILWEGDPGRNHDFRYRARTADGRPARAMPAAND